MVTKKNKELKPRYGRIIGLIILILLVAAYFYIDWDKVIKIKDDSTPGPAVVTDTSGIELISKTIVAEVNDKEILIEDLNREYNALPEQYKLIIKKSEILEQMINQELLLQEAQKIGVAVTDEEIIDIINQAIEESKLSKEEFDQELEKQGLTMEILTKIYQDQLIITRYVNKTISSSLEVSDNEVKEYYNNNEGNFKAQSGQIRARHILLDSLEDAQEIITELNQGADFAELAEEKSIGPSASFGGDLGFFTREEMIPEFSNAAFNLEVNKISEPIETQFGFHIIKRESNIITLEEAGNNIKEILLLSKQKNALDILLTQLRSNADVKVHFKEETKSIPKKTNSLIQFEERCIDKYNIAGNTVIYYTADWCTYCTNMNSEVDKLIAEGANILTVNMGEEPEFFNECFNNRAKEIPQVICANSNALLAGELTEKELRYFIGRC